MSTTTKKRPAKQRKIGVVERHGRHALLEIVESNSNTAKAEYYSTEEIPHAWGDAAYRLEKFDGTTDDVLLDDAGHHACDCKGHVQHGHKTRCRQVAGLLALRATGRLPVAKSKPPAALVELGRDFIPGRGDGPEDIFLHPVLCLDSCDDAA